MKRCSLCVGLLLAIAACLSPLSASADSRPEVRVTYVGNAGFLVSVGDVKILIDALFDGFPGGYTLPADVLQRLLAASPPFDGVDLILVTHRHADHFTADLVRRFMRNSPDAILVAGYQVTSQLSDLESRVVMVNATTGQPVSLDRNGIHIEAIYLCHGIPVDQPEDINYGYVVTVDGVRFFDTGDIDPDTVGLDAFRSYGFAGMGLDIAFVNHIRLAGPYYNPSFVEAIGAKHIIAMHYEYMIVPVDWTGIRRNYPDAVLFTKELQSWTLPAG